MKIHAHAWRQPSAKMKQKLEIEKTRPTFIIKTFKVVYWGSIVYSNSNFFINKTFSGK